MSDISATDAQANLTAWIKASEALARNQSYTIGDRTLTRANAKEVREMITFWRQQLHQSNGTRRSVRYGVH